MSPIRVLVVDDSAFMRKMISDILNADSRLTVIGTARNGREAVEKAKVLLPDVVTMDVEMPVMDGLTALQHIMKQSPVAVIMLSSLTKTGAESTIRAIALGAVDFIAKPSGSISLDIKSSQQEIVDKVAGAARSNLKALTFEQQKIRTPAVMDEHLSLGSPSKRKIVAIGTSTGGPRALQEVLTSLPKELPAPIVIVQHMPPGFTKSLADRLNSLAAINVKEAVNGELLQNGTAYIAPGGFHLRVKLTGRKLAAHVSQDEQVNGHRPSVDVLFSSLAEQSLFQSIAVIMTGMGADGAKGLSILKRKREDTVVLAESKKTATIYGMPQAAYKTGLVNEVRDINEISSSVVNHLSDYKKALHGND